MRAKYFLSLSLLVISIATASCAFKKDAYTTTPPFTVYATKRYPITGAQSVIILYDNHSFQKYNHPISDGPLDIGYWKISNDTLKLYFEYEDVGCPDEHEIRKGNPQTKIWDFKIEGDAIIEIPEFFWHQQGSRYFKVPF